MAARSDLDPAGSGQLATTRLRVGFIGCGAQASHAIWPCLRYAPVEVAWACDLDAQRAEQNRRAFGAERATTDLREVLGDDSVEAVFLIGPPAMQHELGLEVLDAGKHLFIEKPPGETHAHALELEAASRRAGVQCQVGFQKRFALAYGMAREIASRPEFGGVRLCKLNYSHCRFPSRWEHLSDWRAHLIYMSVHPLDLVRFFMGDPVAAHLLKRTASDGRNTCTLTLQYESGASALLNMSACDPLVQEWVELSGANQLIAVHNLVELKHWLEPDADIAALHDDAIHVWHPEFTIPYGQADSLRLQGYAGQVIEFAEGLLEGRSISPSIADGVAAMRFVEFIEQADEGVSEVDARTLTG
jgi:predicted dehydrogenase